jgi:DNA polymerase-3 subunit beta
MRRVLPFASEGSELVRFNLTAGQLELQSEDIDFATSAKESISCEYAGSNMSIGFKGSSIMEILNNLTSEEVTIQLADPSRAGVIVPAEKNDDESVLMLLMPMLLND